MQRMRKTGLTGGAIHPVFAPASLGLLALGTALDVLAGGRPGVLSGFAFWVVAAGVAAGTWCALFGLLDWIFFALLGKNGMCGLDGFATAVVVGLYGLDALLRVDAPSRPAPSSALALEVAGAALLGMKVWIGRELAVWLDERP
jgi:uncharacterized membrane protein